MSISRILSECPNVQMSLGELFIEVGQREQLPFLEFLLSPENAKLIRTEVAPGQGKLKLNLDFTLVFKNFTSMDNQNGNSLISFGEFVRAMWAV